MLPILNPLLPLKLPMVLIRREGVVSLGSFVESNDLEPLLSKLRDRLEALGYESGAEPTDDYNKISMK